MKAYIWILMFFMIPLVSAGSIGDYIPECNYDTYCDHFENSETCPEDCPVTAVNQPVSDNPSSRPSSNRVESQLILNQKKPFPTTLVLSIGFAIVFLILVLVLYSWIHNKQISLKKKKGDVKGKNLLYPKPQRKFRV